MNNDTYKLYYFNINGQAAPIRALLRYLHINFENIIVSDQWSVLKTSGKFEYLQIPGLEINGKMYVQTNAILRYVAKKHNLMGNTPEEEYEINNLIESIEDLWSALLKFTFPYDEQMIKTYKKAFVDKVIQYIKVYQKVYEKHGRKKYLLGDKLTLADIHLSVNLFTFSQYLNSTPKWNDNAPEILSILEKNAKEDLKDFFDKDFVKKKF